jgi:hypothetical protein
MTFFAAFVTARADERAYCASSPATPRAGLRPAGFFVAFFAILSLLVSPERNFQWNRKFHMVGHAHWRRVGYNPNEQDGGACQTALAFKVARSLRLS